MKSFKEFVIEAKMTKKDHIQNYTDLSRPLTHQLYRSHAAGVNPPRKFEHDGQKFDLDALDSIASNVAMKKNTELYSGVKHDPSKHVDEHGHLHLPAYTSTSEYKSVAHKFAKTQASRKDVPGEEKVDGHIIKFNMKKGDRTSGCLSKKSKYGNDSPIGDEKEHLLPRNTKIKIHPTPETHVTDDGRKIHTWNAHIVD
jgi:hypothetical protein